MADKTAPADLTGINVLVVDDDPDILTTVRTGFELCGARVTTVNDGQKGIETARRINPDLVILDMMMPRKSGFVVLENLNNQPERPPVIMITANEGKRHATYANHLGVSDYINKPFALDRLLESACRILGREFRDG